MFYNLLINSVISYLKQVPEIASIDYNSFIFDYSYLDSLYGSTKLIEVKYNYCCVFHVVHNYITMRSTLSKININSNGNNGSNDGDLDVSIFVSIHLSIYPSNYQTIYLFIYRMNR
jgi:hypothetical protein